jgi:Membrane MotB of proton-channel complex MotA/MotB
LKYRLSQDPVLVQVLSLYILLLAFFVLLFHMSRVEELKAQAIAGSLNATFSTNGIPTSDPALLTSVVGNVFSDAVFQREIGDLVQSAIPVAEVVIVKHGSVFEARFPAESLFDESSIELPAHTLRLLDGIAAALSGLAGGVALDLAISVESDWITPRQLGEGQPLAIGRVGALAAAMEAAGAPPGGVAAGVTYGDSEEVRFLFRVRTEDEPAPLFVPVAGEGSR